MEQNFVSSDMIRGHIDTIILLSLSTGDKHTNEIRDEIESRTGGQYSVKQGTFYSSLQRLKKQGYVEEYRSSAKDSIRRKYLHLTEKGSKFIEKNIDQWNYSRNVINNLISDEENQEENNTQIIINETPLSETPTTEFDQILEITEDTPSIKIEETTDTDIDSYFDNVSAILNSTVNLSDNLNDQISENVEIYEDDYVENIDQEYTLNVEEVETEEDIDTLQEFTDIQNDVVIEENIEPISNNEEIVISENQQDFLSEEYVIEDNNEEFTIDTPDFIEVNENEFSLDSILNDNIDDAQDSSTNIIFDNSNTENNFDDNSETNEQEVYDNSYVNSDSILFGSTSTQTDNYSELLDRLFNRQNKEQNTTSLSEQQLFVEENQVINENLDFMPDVNGVIEKPITEKVENHDDLDFNKLLYDDQIVNYYVSNEVKNAEIDYTDIIAYAKQEGFKIKTLTKKQEVDNKKILVNKINFHSSLAILITLLIELLVIFFTFKNHYGLTNTFYVACVVAFSVLPITRLLLYLFNKNKKIKELSTFKSTIEVVCIICINLILAVCAYAIISDVNFYSFGNLLTYLFLPITLILNIPLYYIFKYLLLENPTYYSK